MYVKRKTSGQQNRDNFNGHKASNAAPGLVNGYATEHGFFKVPIGEFVQIFSDIEYETTQPFKG